MPADRWLVLGAVVLYLLALSIPAIESNSFPSLTGFDVLRQGASAWRDGVFAWYANPSLIVALIACWAGYFRIAIGVAALGAILALSSFSAGWVAASAGRSIPAFGFAAGFYLWLGAFAFAMAAGLIGYIRCVGAVAGPD